MIIIRPTAVTGAVLTSTTVPENDYPEWLATTAYALGSRVIRSAKHLIFERVLAGTTATAPESDAVNWLAAGSTNRWAMFDGQVGTATTAESITVVLAPGRVNSLALLQVDASTVSITLVANGQTVYQASLDLDSGNAVGDWYQYFYEPIYQQDAVVITDLLDAALMNVPAYCDGVLTVTLSRPGGTVSCGMLVVGIYAKLGEMEYDASVSIRDYSRKEVDTFGNYKLQPLEFSKRMSGVVRVKAPAVDNVTRILSQYRATNLVWIGATQYSCLIVYGFISDWKMTIKNAVESTFTAEIEGMT